MEPAEEYFQEYLNKHRIPFWFIQQDKKTFSKTVKQLNTKRPDFFILIPNIGFILVDIKDMEPLRKHKKFCIGFKETEKYNNLQKLFNMQVWYIISNKHTHYSTWYCMPASKARTYKHFQVKEDYYSIPVEDFTQLSTHEPIYNLLVK
ncbi:hypothetical protein CL616_00370 [archaeon]|nr:hypothetical protein [archaeon]|tara:strand:- start:608 stop:1051 length:444 start_codon:yes stop_codon:yes gene_type:complete